MTAPRVIELNQILKEKFPGLRLGAGGLASAARAHRPTGWTRLDEALGGGLPVGALSEVVREQSSSGSATLLRWMLRENRFVGLIDGQDSFELGAMDEAALRRLLWVRCRSAEEAMKAADILLRDGNLPIVLLDLAANPPAALRAIPATTWHRFQRILEQTTTACVVFTPRAMIGPAAVRVTLTSRFSLDALEANAEVVLDKMAFEGSDAAQRLEPAAQQLHP